MIQIHEYICRLVVLDVEEETHEANKLSPIHHVGARHVLLLVVFGAFYEAFEQELNQ